MLGILDADHEEENPNARFLLFTKSVCSIRGTRGRVWLAEGSLARRIYGAEQIEGEFLCNYVLNPEKMRHFETGPMKFSGLGAEQEPRIAELRGHPFYLATLFLPQMDSWPGRPNPLFVEFVRAAAAAR